MNNINLSMHNNTLTIVQMTIRFCFPHISEDECLTLDYFAVYQACPLIQRIGVVENNEIVFHLPNFLFPNELMEYFFIWKNGLDHYKSIKLSLNKLLKISEMFENFDFSATIIRDALLNNIEKDNCCSLLEISYEKLNYSSENSVHVDDSWLELFSSALDVMARNILYFIDDQVQMEKIKQLNKKISEEVMDKAFSFFIVNNYGIIDEKHNEANENKTTAYHHYNNYLETGNYIKVDELEKLVDFLFRLRNVNNVYDLLINEYLNISSEDNLTELADIPNPTFKVNIPFDVNNCNYYNEFSIDLGINKSVVFVVFYKKSDDSLNVSFKMIGGKTGQSNSNNGSNSNNLVQTGEENPGFNIFTFLSVVSINEDTAKNQVNVRSVSNNNKSLYPIFKLNNFKQYLTEKSKDFDLSQSVENDFYLKRYNPNPNKNKNNNSNNSNISNNTSQNNFSKQNTGKDQAGSSSSFVSVSENYVRNKIENISLKINLRLCFIHSAISSFLLKQFHKWYHHPHINKISAQLMRILFKNKILGKESEDQVVIALINWLNDEINLNEEIADILEFIDWKNVSFDLIFEMIMKYYKLIEQNDLELFFIDHLLNKLNLDQNFTTLNGTDNLKNNENEKTLFMKMILEQLFKASKKLQYTNLFLENKKISKLNLLIQNTSSSVNNNNKKTFISKSSFDKMSIKNFSNCNNYDNSLNISGSNQQNEVKVISPNYSNYMTDLNWNKQPRNMKNNSSISFSKPPISNANNKNNVSIVKTKSKPNLSIHNNDITDIAKSLTRSKSKMIKLISLNKKEINFNEFKDNKDNRESAFNRNIKKMPLVKCQPRPSPPKKSVSVQKTSHNNTTNFHTANTPTNSNIIKSNPSIKSLVNKNPCISSSSKFIFKAKYTNNNITNLADRFMEKMINLNYKSVEIKSKTPKNKFIGLV